MQLSQEHKVNGPSERELSDIPVATELSPSTYLVRVRMDGTRALVSRAFDTLHEKHNAQLVFTPPSLDFDNPDPLDALDISVQVPEGKSIQDLLIEEDVPADQLTFSAIPTFEPIRNTRINTVA